MCLWKWYAAYITVLSSSVHALYISSWVSVQAQVASPVIITHPLGQIPAKVEVQVKVQESGNDVIFPASGSAQRDDDSSSVYGGVVYFYNEFHVKIFVPVRDENTALGVAIYTGHFVGPFAAKYADVSVRVKVWDGCDLPLASFTSAGTTAISTGDSYKSFTHGLGRYPDLVVVQLRMNNGYISEAGGVTFNSVQETYQSLCGAVFGYNDQEIRLWSASGISNVYVACAKDGWGTEEPQETSATVHIQAWVLCTKQFTKSHMLNMKAATVVYTVPFDAVYSLNTTLVSVQMKVLESNNEGFIFYAGGSAMIDTSSDPFGALIYAYTESEVFLWRPDSSVSHGYLVYLGGQWGGANQTQQSTFVEVTVRVIELAGSPCSESNSCTPNWASLTSTCSSTDCPIPVNIPNAQMVYTGVTNGSSTLYACAYGYTANNSDSLVHCVDGTWTTSTMSCTVVPIVSVQTSMYVNQTIEERIKEIKKELTVDKKTTSSYTRSLISVYDPRPSSVAIGSCGIGLLCLAALLLLLPDVINVFKYLCDSQNKDNNYSPNS